MVGFRKYAHYQKVFQHVGRAAAGSGLIKMMFGIQSALMDLCFRASRIFTGIRERAV